MSPKLVRIINSRVLSAFSIVALPILAVGVLLVLGSGQARLRDSYGRHLAEVAQQTAAAIDTYVFRQIVDVLIFASVPDVQRVATSESQRPLDAEEVRTLDRRWTSERVVPSMPILAGVMTNPAARFFASIVEHDRIYREIMLTDRFGRLVAASNRTSDYYQADEEWWKETFDDGVRGRVHVSDVVRDESARDYVIDIAVPVTDPATRTLVGVLKISTSAREMLDAVASVRLGSTGRAVLVRKDGAVVSARPPITPGVPFFAADLVRERVQAAGKTMSADFATYFSARDTNGSAQLIGIAPSQLAQSYPVLSWLVAVYQADEELFAPFRNQFWYLALVVALAAMAVLGLTLWFSMRLAAPSIDVEIGPAHPTLSRLDHRSSAEPVGGASGSPNL